MTQAQIVTSSAKRRLTGIVADGAFKVVLGAAYVIASAQLGGLLGVSAWLMAVSGVVLLIGGGIELRYVRSRPIRTHLRLMIAYDSGWVLTALAGALMAWLGGSAGGEVWIGYQAAAPLAFAALLMAAAPVRPVADRLTENSAH
ncbi:hypothetical protein [Streptomyces sp. NPDC088762]|uniref:hypothetical protein n=1 Tax=Streptomyces sp. NPDC088762 TaxID=3365891 RepID=UPI003813B067